MSGTQKLAIKARRAARKTWAKASEEALVASAKAERAWAKAAEARIAFDKAARAAG
jgi:hypothetical protein